LEEGALFGGEVLIRWQELVGADRVRVLIDTGGTGGRRAARAGRSVDGRLRVALVDAAGQAIQVALDRAARRTEEEWGLVLCGDAAAGSPGYGRGVSPDAERAGNDGRTDWSSAGTLSADEARAAAADWLDRLPGTIRDQVRGRRAGRATTGAGARGAALLLGVAAVAGRSDSTEPTTAAAHGLVKSLFGADDAARLLAVARAGLRDVGAALLERSADGYRARLAGCGIAAHQADDVLLAQARVQAAR
jgi:hypothetical protein